MPVVFNAKDRRPKKSLSKTRHFAPKEEHRLLHALCIKPSESFEGRNDDELTILILRKHPLTQLSWVIVSVLILILPAFFHPFLVTYLSIRQVLFIDLFWYSFLFSFVFVNILSWVFNVGIVTNKRILDIDFHGIFSKETSSCSVSSVEEVTVKSGGFIASVFNYGNVFIQTAGEKQNIEYMRIPNPSLVSSIINEVKEGEYG